MCNVHRRYILMLQFIKHATLLNVFFLFLSDYISYAVIVFLLLYFSHRIFRIFGCSVDLDYVRQTFMGRAREKGKKEFLAEIVN